MTRLFPIHGLSFAVILATMMGSLTANALDMGNPYVAVLRQNDAFSLWFLHDEALLSAVSNPTYFNGASVDKKALQTKVCELVHTKHSPRINLVVTGKDKHLVEPTLKQTLLDHCVELDAAAPVKVLVAIRTVENNDNPMLKGTGMHAYTISATLDVVAKGQTLRAAEASVNGVGINLTSMMSRDAMIGRGAPFEAALKVMKTKKRPVYKKGKKTGRTTIKTWYGKRDHFVMSLVNDYLAFYVSHR